MGDVDHPDDLGDYKDGALQSGTDVICVGGPADGTRARSSGRRMSVSTRQPGNVSSPMKFTQANYVLGSIRVQGEEIQFYYPEDWAPAKAIKWLLEDRVRNARTAHQEAERINIELEATKLKLEEKKRANRERTTNLISELLEGNS